MTSHKTANPIAYLTKKLWKYSNGNRRWVVFYSVLFTLANGVSVLEPLVVGKILNIIQQEGLTATSFPHLGVALGIFFSLNIFFWVFHGPARIIENKNAFLARANYKQYLLSGVMAFPMEWHADHHSGDTIDKVEKGTQALYRFAGDTFRIIEVLVRLVVSYIAMSYFNVQSGFIAIALVLLAFGIITQFDKVLVAQYKAIFGFENKISEKIFDAISNITTVIILRIEQLVTSSIYKKIMEPLGLYMKNNVINELKWFLVSMCSSLMTVSVIGTYLYSNYRSGGMILIGSVYALYGYVGKITELFFNFAGMYSDIVQQKAAVMNAEEIANTFIDGKRARSLRLKSTWKTIGIKDLRFSYNSQTGAHLHLDDISLSINHGERIALIGASGSGKTTFLKVIRELYKPQQAKVTLDGKPLKHGFQSISSDIALIPQDPEIFTTTIKENITVGVAHDNAYIKKFTDMACFTNVVERLPNKLESFIFEKGVNLSGGERQRLALARGLMACEDKSIVLLDEPTSSVDSKNELHIFQNIFTAFKQKTVIASVHRLHLLSLFDTIYFFKHGRIIASGSLQDLLNTSAEFKDLWAKYHKVHRPADEKKGSL